MDHKDETTPFELAVINKRNEGLILGCVLRQSEIKFTKVLNVSGNALDFINQSRSERLKADMDGIPWNSHADSHGVKWEFLSESL